jgi:hypothetical protein
MTGHEGDRSTQPEITNDRRASRAGHCEPTARSLSARGRRTTGTSGKFGSRWYGAPEATSFMEMSLTTRKRMTPPRRAMHRNDAATGSHAARTWIHREFFVGQDPHRVPPIACVRDGVLEPQFAANAVRPAKTSKETDARREHPLSAMKIQRADAERHELAVCFSRLRASTKGWVRASLLGRRPFGDWLGSHDECRRCT